MTSADRPRRCSGKGGGARPIPTARGEGEKDASRSRSRITEKTTSQNTSLRKCCSLPIKSSLFETWMSGPAHFHPPTPRPLPPVHLRGGREKGVPGYPGRPPACAFQVEPLPAAAPPVPSRSQHHPAATAQAPLPRTRDAAALHSDKSRASPRAAGGSQSVPGRAPPPRHARAPGLGRPGARGLASSGICHPPGRPPTHPP